MKVYEILETVSAAKDTYIIFHDEKAHTFTDKIPIKDISILACGIRMIIKDENVNELTAVNRVKEIFKEHKAPDKIFDLLTRPCISIHFSCPFEYTMQMMIRVGSMNN